MTNRNERTGFTTQTGIPLIRCGTCGKHHPETRRHCVECGAASMFQRDGVCGVCRRKETT